MPHRPRRAVLWIAAALLLGAAGSLYAAPSFVTLEELARTRGLEWRWDPVARTATVWSASGSARFRPGSAYCLVAGRLRKLDGSVSYHGGAVWIPSSADPLLEALASVASPAPRLPYPVVALDPGHGGKDFGAVSPSGTREKDLTLDLASRIARRLEAGGARVVMTRGSDVFVPLAERVETARSGGADLFLSIHANASTTPGLQGFEVYVLSDEVDDLELASLRAADEKKSSPATEPALTDDPQVRSVYWDLVRRQSRRQSARLAARIVEAVDGNVVVARRRLRRAQFHVLKWTEMPAILVEAGYLTNSEDESRLADESYRQAMADAIARAVLGDAPAGKRGTDAR